MVWVDTKYIGIGKATSSTGKVFVVAYYYPAGKYKANIFLLLNISIPFFKKTKMNHAILLWHA